MALQLSVVDGVKYIKMDSPSKNVPCRCGRRPECWMPFREVTATTATNIGLCYSCAHNMLEKCPEKMGNFLFFEFDKTEHGFPECTHEDLKWLFLSNDAKKNTK